MLFVVRALSVFQFGFPEDLKAVYGLCLISSV